MRKDSAIQGPFGLLQINAEFNFDNQRDIMMNNWQSTLLRWKLIFWAMPYALAVLILKLVLVEWLNFDGILDIHEIRIIFTAGVFLIGFMLTGTLTDYKESEKIPGEIASLLEAMEEMATTLSLKTGLNPASTRKAVKTISIAIYDRFFHKISQEELYDAFAEFNTHIHELDKAGAAAPIIGRLHQHLHDLRGILTRTWVISKTGFLGTGYALLELLVVAISILLLVTNFQSYTAMITIVFFVELLYVYMYKLIKDIDDPFEYPATGHEEGSTEVPLFPLEDYMKRLDARME